MVCLFLIGEGKVEFPWASSLPFSVARVACPQRRLSPGRDGPGGWKEIIKTQREPVSAGLLLFIFPANPEANNGLIQGFLPTQLMIKVSSDTHSTCVSLFFVFSSGKDKQKGYDLNLSLSLKPKIQVEDKSLIQASWFMQRMLTHQSSIQRFFFSQSFVGNLHHCAPQGCRSAAAASQIHECCRRINTSKFQYWHLRNLFFFFLLKYWRRLSLFTWSIRFSAGFLVEADEIFLQKSRL